MMLFFLSVTGVIILITEDDVILSINEDYVILSITEDDVILSMLRINETRHVFYHETCICKCRLDLSVCNDKQIWNNDGCRCECK